MWNDFPIFVTCIFAAEGSTLFLTICFSRTSPFPAELCIAERQLDFGDERTDFQIYDVFWCHRNLK
jgi:hypothetical protein